MIKLITLILLFIPTLAFSSDGNYIDKFPIYLHGDVEIIASIYNSIAFVTKHDLYETAIEIAVLLSMVGAGFVLLSRADYSSSFKTFIFTSLSVTILLVPVDVHIVDKRINHGILDIDTHAIGYAKVSNVPYLTALAPSIATTISSDLIELIDDGFGGITATDYAGHQSIGNVGYAKIGFNGSFEMIDTIIRRFDLDDLGDNGAKLKTNTTNYIKSCVLPMTATKPEIKTKLTYPKKDFFSEIAPKTPTNNGIVFDSGDTIYDGGTIVTCTNFFNTKIKNVFAGLNTKVNAKLAELLDVNNTTNLTGLNNIALADITSDVITGTTSQLEIFAYNTAAAPIMKAAIDNYYRGTDLSGQNIANDITASKSTAKMQTEGLGQFKWMAKILPVAMHFFFAIILAASILALIFAIIRGHNGGIEIAKNYFLGFIQFESIRVSLALVNNIVNYYSSVNAADKLAEFGGNPLAPLRLPDYLDYIATLEGVMGVLGVSAIFIIPAIIIKGDISSATSALQGLSGRYVGNDVQTASDTAAYSAARQRTLGNLQQDEEAMAKLSKMGIAVPNGSTPLEYMNRLTKEMGSMSQGASSYYNQEKLDDYSKGMTSQASMKMNQTAGFGNTAGLNSASNVGYQDGQVQGSSVNYTDDFRKNSNWNQDQVGRGNSLMQFSKDMKSMGMSRGVSDEELDQYSKGSQNQGRMDANKTLGAGRVILTSADMNAIQNVVKSGIDSEIGKGRGVTKNYEKYGEDVYKENSEYGERSSVGETRKDIMNKGGIDKAVAVNIANAGIKAQQQLNSIQAYQDEKVLDKNGDITDKGEKLFRDIAKSGVQSEIGKGEGIAENYEKYGEDVYKDTSKYGEKSNAASTVAKIKTQGSIDQAVANDYSDAVIKAEQQASTVQAYGDRKILDKNGDITNRGRKFVDDTVGGKINAQVDEVDFVNENYKGGYKSFLSNSAINKADTGMRTLDAKKGTGEISTDGSYTELGGSALGQSVTTQSSEALQRAKDFNDQEKMNKLAKDAVQKVYDAVRASTEAKELAKKTPQEEAFRIAEKEAEKAAQVVADELSSDGNASSKNGIVNNDFKAKTGSDMARFIGEGAGRRYTEKFDGATVGGVSLSLKDGQVSVTESNNANMNSTVSANSGEKIDSTNTMTTGNKRDYAQSWEQSVAAYNLKAKEGLEIDPTKKLSEHSDEAIEAFVRSEEGVNFIGETQNKGLAQTLEMLGTSAGAALAVAATVDTFTGGNGRKAIGGGLNKTTEATKNKASELKNKIFKKKPSATETFNSTSNPAENTSVEPEQKTNSNNINSEVNHDGSPKNDLSNSTINKQNSQQTVSNFTTEAEMKAAGAAPDHQNVRARSLPFWAKVGVGVTTVAGVANADEVGEKAVEVGGDLIKAEIEGIQSNSKLLSSGDFGDYLHGVANSFFGNDTGNSLSASVSELKKGNLKNSVMLGLNSVANAGDSLLNGAAHVSNSWFDTNFSLKDRARNMGTEYYSSPVTSSAIKSNQVQSQQQAVQPNVQQQPQQAVQPNVQQQPQQAVQPNVQQQQAVQPNVQQQPQQVVQQVVQQVAQMNSQNFDNNFSQALRSTQVRQEYANMQEEFKSGGYMSNVDDSQFQMKSTIEDMNNRMRRGDFSSEIQAHAGALTEEDYKSLERKISRKVKKQID